MILRHEQNDRAFFYACRAVMSLPYISKEEIAQDREMDLLTYLRRFERNRQM